MKCKKNEKKKGFTLVEVLAVVVVLLLIAVLAFPRMNDVLNSNKIDSYKNITSSIILAAQSYNSNEELALENISLSTLREQNYVSGKYINPINNKEMNGCVIVEKTGVDFTYTYDDNPCESKKMRYYEGILNGADPMLDSGMIPVTIDNDGTLHKADIYSEWYKYENKTWANAVLVSNNRNKYLASEPGTIIVQTDVAAEFVWIPRFKYKLFNTAGVVGTTPSTFDISFESKNIPKSLGRSDGQYLTHPAFTFGDVELNGFWTGKYETSAISSSACYTNSSETNCNNENVEPRILPNVNSLRNQNVYNEFVTAKKFKDAKYGMSSETTMMTNTQWGAVTYLTNSIYGVNDQVVFNNSYTYTTGCAANSLIEFHYGGCQNAYNTVQGYKASTTGNISGIYDMAGGAWEYTMAYLTTTSTEFGATGDTNASGFTGTPDQRYWDKISSTDRLTACNGKKCFGQGTIETSGWYSNYSSFVISTDTWLLRGGNSSDNKNAVNSGLTNAGIFAYGNDNGRTEDCYAFRTIALVY